MESVKLQVQVIRGQLDELIKDVNSIKNTTIKVDSSGVQAVQDFSKSVSSASNSMLGYAKSVEIFKNREEEASTVIVTTNEGLGRTVEVTQTLDKETKEYTETLRKVTDNQEKAQKEIQKAAEQEQRDLERTSAQAQTLATNFSNITRRINELTEHYPESTFSSLSSEIGNARTRLEGLNAQFKNGEITNADYIAGVKSIGSEYQSLNGKLSVILETTQRLSMTEAEQAEYLEREMAKEAAAIDKAQSSAVSLETQYSKLSQSIVKLSENYPAGTFDDLNHRLEEARFQLDTTVRAFESGTIGSQEFMERIQAASGTLQSLTSELAHTQENTERLPMTMSAAQSSAQKLEKSFSSLAQSISSASQIYPSDTFFALSVRMETARSDLAALNEAYANGEITQLDYTSGVQTLSEILGTLSTEFVTTKGSTERLSMSFEQARKTAVSLETQYANLLRNIKGLKAQYPAETFDELERQIREAYEELQNLDVASSTYSDDVSRLNRILDNGKARLAGIREETKKLDKVTESLWTNIQKFARWYIIGNVFTQILSSFKEALSVMKEVDSELTNIQKVTDRTDAEMQKLAKSAYSVASAYGVAASDYLESVGTFAKAGYDELSESLAELATKTQLVGDVTADIANQFLISVDAAWKMNGNVAMLSKTLDAANTIENNYATSIQKLAEGMPIVASVAAQAGMSVEETMAALGTITSVTQESGTKAATALRALLLNLIGAAGEYEDGIEVTEESIKSLNDVLNVYAADAMKAAEAAGTVINPMTAIAALAEASEKGALNQAKLFEMLSGLGGKLRTNQLTALVTNFEMFNEQLEMAGSNAGSADKEIAVMLGTWESKTNILKNTWTEFISNTVNSGLIKWFVDAGTSILDFADNIGLATPVVLTLWTTLKNGKTIIKAIRSETNSLAASMSVLGAAIGIAVSAVSISVMAYRQHLENLRETASESLDVAQKTNLANESIYEAYAAMESATSGTEAFDSAAKRLAETLGTTLPDNTQNSIDKLRELTEEQLHTAAVSASVAVANAENALRSHSSDVYMPEIKGDGTHSELNSQISEILIGAAVHDFSPDVNPDVYVPFSDTAKGIKDFYEALLGVKNLIEEEYWETDDNSLLNSRTYKDVSRAIDRMKESYETYVSSVEALNIAKAREEFAEYIRTVGIDSPEAFDAYIKSIENSTEYSDEYRKVLIDTANDTFPQFTQAVEDVGEALENTRSGFAGFDNLARFAASNTTQFTALLRAGKEVVDEYNESTGIDSQEAFDKFIESVSTSKEYVDEQKAAIIEAARYAFPEYSASVEIADEKTSALSATVLDTITALSDFSRNVNAADTAIGGVIDALDKFGAGSYEVYEAMLALEEAIPGSTAQLYDFETGALKVDAALLGDKASLLDLIKTNNQVNLSNTISELERLRDASIQTMAATMAAVPTELQGAAQELTNLSVMAYNVRIQNAKKAITELNAIFDNLGSRSSYTPKTTKTGSGTSTTSSSQKTPEEIALEAHENNIKLLKSELTLLEKSNADTDSRVAKMREIQAALHEEAEYMRSIGADQTEINGLSSEWWDIQNDINKLLEDTTDLLKEYKDTISGLETHLELIEKQGASAEEQIDVYRRIQNELHKEAEYLRSIGASQEDIDELSIKWWNIEEKIKGVQDDIAKTQKELFDSLKATIDEYYDKAVSDKEKELELDEKILAVQKAQAALANAQAERSVRYYNAATGTWEWGADAQKVKSAQETLESAQNALDEYNTTQAEKEFKSAWETIADQIKSGASTFQEAYDYMLSKMMEIQDTYGVDLYEVLETSIGGFKEINAGIDEIDKQLIITLMRANSVNWWSADDAGKEYLHAQNENLAKLIGATYDQNGYWMDAKGYRLYDPNDGNQDPSASGSTPASPAGTDNSREQAIISRMKENAAKWWFADEAMKANLEAQNESLGRMIGAVKDENGYWYDSRGARLFDSGGVLQGVGGIKATTEDEMILPPDITKAILSPVSDGLVMNRLDMMRQCFGIGGSNTSGAYSGYSIGTQNNGDTYNMNGYSISEQQAKSMTVYDFARLAKGLGISNRRN